MRKLTLTVSIIIALSLTTIYIIANSHADRETIIDIPEELIPLLKEETAVDLVGTIRNDTLFIEFLTDEDR